MRWLALSVMLTCSLLNAGVSLANALDDDSIYGTHSVVFQPMQAGGELQGCTLVYKAVQADYAYLGGNPVVIVGNIGVYQTGGELLLGLKIGVKDLNGYHPFVRPNFAYLQTMSHSTAKVQQKAMDGDDGYRLYAYSLYAPSVMDFLMEMMDTKKVTVAFNRKKNGMDVLVPVDLDVIDAEFSGGDRVVRKRSKDTVANFDNCFLKLVEQARSSLDKK